MEQNFKSEIIFSSFEMTPRQKVLYEDLAAAVSINQEMQREGKLEMSEIKGFYVIHVDNPLSKNNKEYEQVVIIANNTRYYSGSNSLKRSMMELYEKLGDELFIEESKIGIVKQASKNYTGKDFYKAVLLA